MEFRLLYQGPLLAATREKTRAPEKHALRRDFHKQLRRLWHTNPNLLRLAQQQGMLDASRSGVFVSHGDEDKENYVQTGLDYLGQQWKKLGFKFIPLVTEELCLQCGIEILFLRPSDSGTLIQGGDLDNRLKTLFDALRMPENLSEVAGVSPGSDETPFYCLLQDDRLISEVKVTTDNLLLLPHGGELKQNDVFLTITVRLNPTIPHNWNWVFRQ